MGLATSSRILYVELSQRESHTLRKRYRPHQQPNSGWAYTHEVLDHLIISTKSYESFGYLGLMKQLEKSTKYVLPFEQIERIRTEEKKIREEAVWIAEEKGIKKGEIKGKKVGEKEKAIKIAKTMKQKGEPIEKIIEYTGLTKREIEKIKV